ncbi:carboxyl transferase domain-containing protein [Cupriavidus sp. D39]|uniref:carboxyl transferase domain-containing protein n=1 Tax=Cupriavidus sp. D39 TaxID=2997877 RepID=UPI00226E3286|nr:carboxyl transferase domain-containing protein [Cupriavidus sp. D39]MCY0852685.1 hypothetical protein [Cupriavidus sp. D39]
MDMSQEILSEGLLELEQRRAFSRALGGPEAVERHHAAGKLTIRERIDGLCDAQSFHEVGRLTGQGQYDEHGVLVKVTPAPYVMGLATIGGRPVAIGGEDYTVRGAPVGAEIARRAGRAASWRNWPSTTRSR